MTQARNTICLWFDKDAEDAARFYAEMFPDSEVKALPISILRSRNACSMQ